MPRPCRCRQPAKPASSLPLFKLLLATALAVVSSVQAQADFNCQFTTAGKNFDLTPLRGPVYHTDTYESPPTTYKSTYSLSLCDPLPRDANVQDRDQCPPNTRACFTTINQKSGEPDRVTFVVPIAGGVGNIDPTTSYIAGSKGSPDRLNVILRGGNVSERQRWANLTLFCDASKEGTEPTSWKYVRTEQQGVLSVEWSTKYACAQGGGGGSSPSPPGERKGTSFFGLIGKFFTLLLMLLVLYFVVGAYYQWSQYGSRGYDLIPNRAFWADLPYVLSDLFRGTGRNSAGYSSL